MSIVNTWDWDKLKITEDVEDDYQMKCKFCGHEFVPCEHFIIGHGNNGEVFMCETCFFNFALDKLNCKEFQMSCNGVDYYDPRFYP